MSVTHLNAGVPTDDELEQKTVDEEPPAETRGPDTDDLSADSEDEHGHRTHTATHSANLYRRMRPHLRSRQVKVLFFVNCALGIINLLLLMALFVLVWKVVSKTRQYSREENMDVPCYYEWQEWGTCSASCYRPNSPLPMRTRKVNPETVVEARGKYAKTNQCPSHVINELHTYEDKAPCNVHLCPVLLSKYDFPDIPKDGPSLPSYWMNPADHSSECYQIRPIPPTNQLIEIDTYDLIRFVGRGNCSKNDDDAMTMDRSKRQVSHTEL